MENITSDRIIRVLTEPFGHDPRVKYCHKYCHTRQSATHPDHGRRAHSSGLLPSPPQKKKNRSPRSWQIQIEFICHALGVTGRSCITIGTLQRACCWLDPRPTASNVRVAPDSRQAAENWRHVRTPPLVSVSPSRERSFHRMNRERGQPTRMWKFPM